MLFPSTTFFFPIKNRSRNWKRDKAVNKKKKTKEKQKRGVDFRNFDLLDFALKNYAFALEVSFCKKDVFQNLEWEKIQVYVRQSLQIFLDASLKCSAEKQMPFLKEILGFLSL